jgi:hypothetical protein
VVSVANGGSPRKINSPLVQGVQRSPGISRVGEDVCACVACEKSCESETLEDIRDGGAGRRRTPTLILRRFFAKCPVCHTPVADGCVCGCHGVDGLSGIFHLLVVRTCVVPRHHTDITRRTAYRRLRKEMHWCASGPTNQCPPAWRCILQKP